MRESGERVVPLWASGETDEILVGHRPRGCTFIQWFMNYPVRVSETARSLWI